MMKGKREASRANFRLDVENVEWSQKRGAHQAPSSLYVLGTVGVGTLPDEREPL